MKKTITKFILSSVGVLGISISTMGQVVYEPNVMVSTFAGNGNVGSDDGQGTAASFYIPGGLAIDNSGNIYVADQDNHKIRKITPSGLVSTLAGSGLSGSKDGKGSEASFNLPAGLAVDLNGNVYVADANNYKIRKITSDGFVSTLAGSGIKGSANGQGSLASFNLPVRLAVDASGYVYVSDKNNNKIRKITPNGTVSTLAGSGDFGDDDGLGTVATFYGPNGIVLDADGNIFVADGGNNKIRKILPSGMVTTFAGNLNRGNNDGLGTAARFNIPSDITIDGNGNFYITDAINNKIRKITPDGKVSTLAGSGSFGKSDGEGSLATFYLPDGLVIDMSNNLYLTDGSNKIRKITIGLNTGIGDENIISQISLYPNPAQNSLQISSSISLTTYEIESIAGNRVQKGTLTNNSVNITLLPAGLYILKIPTEKGVSVLKFVKE